MEDQELKEKIQKVQTDAIDFLQSANLEELILNNTIEFTIEDTKYRVTRPNFAYKQLALRERNNKYISLLKDPTNLMEKDLIVLYANRGISIAEIDNKYKNLQTQKLEYDKKLGLALTENKLKEELDIFKKEIEAITLEQNKILMEKSVLLESSIESQVQVYIYTFLASLITEKFVPGKDLGGGNKEADIWIRAWKNYDEFVKEHESTVNTTVWYASIVSKNELTGL